MGKLGIIGGMGPLASAYLYQRIAQLTKTTGDTGHIEVLLHSIPDTPDRTAHILDPASPSPVPRIASAARGLAAMGCDVIAIPCVTAHAFLPQIRDSAPGVHFIDAVGELSGELSRQGIHKAGILASTGTVRAGFLNRSLSCAGVETVIPSEAAQELVTRIIYDFVKCGREIDMAMFHSACDELFARGVQVCVLGCTELSLANRFRLDGQRFVDVSEVLARRCVEACGAQLRYV